MAKDLALALLATLVGSVGHVLLAKGMKTAGGLTDAPAGHLAAMLARVTGTPWVPLGVVLQAVFFFIYLALLSRAEVSWVLPVTAAGYVVVALLAQLLLAEAVTPARWLGIALIVAGVALVSRT